MSLRKNRVGFFDRAVALVAALLVFAGFAAYLWFNLQSDDEEERETIQAFNADEIATIAATTVTEDQIKKQKDEILKAEKEKQRKEKLRQEQEKKKLADLKKKQAQEKKKLDDIKKKQAEEEKAIALKKKKAEEDEKKRKENEKKRKEDEKKRKEAEEERKKKEAEAKKKREAEEKARQAEEDAKQQRQDALRAEIEAERQAEVNAERQQALAQQSARNSTTLLNRYAALIKEKLQSNFIVPIGSRATKVPVVNIRLDESGNVLSSRIVSGRGDLSFDQAVLAAAAKSSPLPLPKDNPEVRKELQDINLRANF